MRNLCVHLVRLEVLTASVKKKTKNKNKREFDAKKKTSRVKITSDRITTGGLQPQSTEMAKTRRRRSI